MTKNRYIKPLCLLVIFVLLVLIIVYSINCCNKNKNVLEIGLVYGRYSYHIEIMPGGNVILNAGFRNTIFLWDTIPFLQKKGRLEYKITLSKADVDRIFSFADKVCEECKLIKKPNNYNFEVPPHEVQIKYKHYKIDHYLDTGEEPKEIPILQEFVELIKEKTKFNPAENGGYWKMVFN